jgi:hypothetical protein
MSKVWLSEQLFMITRQPIEDLHQFTPKLTVTVIGGDENGKILTTTVKGRQQEAVEGDKSLALPQMDVGEPWRWRMAGIGSGGPNPSLGGGGVHARVSSRRSAATDWRRAQRAGGAVRGGTRAREVAGDGDGGSARAVDAAARD